MLKRMRDCGTFRQLSGEADYIPLQGPVPLGLKAFNFAILQGAKQWCCFSTHGWSRPTVVCGVNILAAIAYSVSQPNLNSVAMKIQNRAPNHSTISNIRDRPDDSRMDSPKGEAHFELIPKFFSLELLPTSTWRLIVSQATRNAKCNLGFVQVVVVFE